MSKFYTVQEVADLLRLSNMTVYRLIEDGKLDAIRVGRNFRIHGHSIDKVLKEGA